MISFGKIFIQKIIYHRKNNMSFSQKLTDMYNLLQQTKGSLEIVNSNIFKEYLDSLSSKDFAEAVFVYGSEIRDEDTGTVDNYVSTLISKIEELYQTKHKEEIENDLKLFSIYNLGLANMSLYFCQRSGFKNTTSLSSGRVVDIDKSIYYLRKSLGLMERTIDIAPGLYLHQCIRTLEYIYSIFLNYNVDNNNIPIDLDSVYVFIDQLDSDNIWNELARQMKAKYKL